jgi:hypothetical protein
MYKNERHSAATPKIVVEDMALHVKEGHSPVAPDSLSPDVMAIVDIHETDRDALKVLR